jgi:hypothetical protein
MWPSHGCGSIIVNCRSELTAASAVIESIEIPAFTREEGGALLLQELGMADSSTTDQELSNSLSETWGGHALTIDVMARNMRARKKPLKEFSKAYKDNPQSLHKKPRRRIDNPYYDRPDDTESLWKIAFDQLEPLEEQIFGVLSMLGPNDVPAYIFYKVDSIEGFEDLKGDE